MQYDNLSSLIELIPDAAVVVSAEGRLTAVSQKAAELFGYAADDLTDRPLAILLPERFRGPHEQHVRDFFDDPEARPMGAGLNLFARRKDGSEFPAEISLRPVETEDGSRTLAVIRDITDRRDTQETLRRSEAQYRSLFEFAPEAIVVADPATGHLEDCNEAAVALFGREQDELVGSHYTTLHPPDMHGTVTEIFQKHAARIQDGKRVEAMEMPIRHPGEGVRFAVITAAPFVLDGRTHVLAFFRDVTERREGRKALREFERRHENMQRIASLGHWVWDMRTGDLEWSDEVFRIFGYEAGAFEPTYERFLDMAHPGDRDTIRRAVQEESYHTEHRIIRPDGEIRVVEEQGQVTRWEEGEPVEMTGTVQDITDQRKMERRMREAQNIAQFGYWTIVPEAGEATWSDGLFRMLGYEPEAFEPTLEDCFAAVHPDDVPQTRTFVQALQEGGEPISEELRLVRTDGSIRIVETRGAVSHVDDQGHTYITGTHFDVTEQRRAQQELNRHRELLEMLFDRIPVMITMYDPGREHFQVNPEFERVLGWTKEDTSGGDLLAKCYPDPDYRAEVESFMENPEGEWRDFEVHTKDGDTVSTSWTNLRLSNDTHVGIGIDLTERKRLETQLRRAQKMETVGTLAGGVAHDFNNIIHAVKAYLQLIEAELPDDHDVQPLLSRAQSGVHRSEGLVEKLLTFSRQDTSTEHVPVEVCDVVQESIELSAPSLPDDVSVRTRLPGGCTVLGDPGELHQVVTNIITNAGQAMAQVDGRDPVLDVSVRPIDVDADLAQRHLNLDPGRYVVLSISDTGPGMDAQTQERIFEPFFTTKKVGEGTGLGLAVVHGIVQSHSGEIVVYSEVGEGTTFDIYLPWASPEEAEPSSAPPEPDLKANREGHLLFVDDDPQIVEMEVVRLQALGYEVTPAEDVQAALEVFEAHPEGFDAVVTDYAMPGRTGLDLSQTLRTGGFEGPIVLMSGFSAQVAPRDMTEAGVTTYLRKPVGGSELAQTLQSVME
jgi:PAS domain S-box-containing protein